MENLEIPLTSFGVPIDDIAYHMVDTLLQFIQDKHSVPFVKKLTPTITERTSCAHTSPNRFFR